METIFRSRTIRPSKRGNKALYKINTKGVMPEDEMLLSIRHETSTHVETTILLGKDLHNNDKVYVQGIEWGSKFRYKILGVSGHYRLKIKFKLLDENPNGELSESEN
jgi:hypothetical protein